METDVGGVGLLGRGPERTGLDQLLSAIRRGESRTLMLRGEAGIGKTALLDYLVASASGTTVVRAAGVESEMELAYASLHQLCEPLFDRLDRLPSPQRQGLEVVFGLSDGEAPDRFLVGLAVLSLISEASEERPLLCVVDDAQWLDQSSALTLGFVSRRLLAEPVGLVFAARDPGEALAHVPQRQLRGLVNGDARALLKSAARIRLDRRVRDRIVAETRGNPLALLEVPRGLSETELGGFGAGPVRTSPSGAEESFRRRIATLPEETRRLLLIAAADPLGQPSVVWRAASLQGIHAGAALPAGEEGLCEFGAYVRFRHPLVRAVAYRSASAEDRRRAHAALAEATDAETDPDRQAWHRALASAGPDDSVADELERSAARARARGGQAAAAAFLERSVDLTVDPGHRAERALAAAEAKYLAGLEEDALRLAGVAELGSLSEPERVRVDVLRARIAVMQRSPGDAPRLLLRAAQRLDQFDRRLASETYRDALIAALYAGRFTADTGMSEIAAAIRSAAAPAEPPSAADELLAATALLIEEGWTAGAERAHRAVAACCVTPIPDGLDAHWLWFAVRLLAQYVWDFQAWDTLSARTLALVRDGGVLALVPSAASQRAGWTLFSGDLAAAAGLVEEQDTVQEAIGGFRSPGSRIVLAAFCGRKAELVRLDEETRAGAVARGDGSLMALLHWATAVLYNGLGRYDKALEAARLGAGFPGDMHVSNWALGEVVEAAARRGEPGAAAEALGRLAEMARACGTDWILGVEARARALVSDPSEADALYQSAIQHLTRTPLRTELARGHLLYGEWLRRENRRVDAREQLRVAYEEFTSIGMEAFAERARTELLATGEKVRKRTVETRDELTPQERQIAQMAREGLSNREIGARLFLSHRTIESHLSKVFGKLEIRNRRELGNALARLESDC
jgi:DNA-binding CsgD family transcriptional regulator